MRDLEMINSQNHSHKHSYADISSTMTQSVRHLGNVFEEQNSLIMPGITPGLKTMSHTSNNVSLASNQVFDSS